MESVEELYGDKSDHVMARNNLFSILIDQSELKVVSILIASTVFSDLESGEKVLQCLSSIFYTINNMF